MPPGIPTRLPEYLRTPWVVVIAAFGFRLFYIFQHHLALYYAKCPVVHGNNGTVAAQMLATARGLRITHNARGTIGHDQLRVCVERRQTITMRRHEL